MSDAENYWFVVLAIDKEPIRGLIEGVVPASYKPTSEVVWCMCKADTKERALEIAEESFSSDLASGERLALASVAQLWNPEVL